MNKMLRVSQFDEQDVGVSQFDEQDAESKSI